MRIYYNNRGQARGYSTGIGGYFIIQFLQLCGALIIAVLFLTAVAAIAVIGLLLVVIGWTIQLTGSERGQRIRQAGRDLPHRLRRNRP